MKKSPIQNIHNEPVNQPVNNETVVDESFSIFSPSLSYRDLQRKMLIAMFNQMNSCDIELLMDAASNIWLDCPYLHHDNANTHNMPIKGNDI